MAENPYSVNVPNALQALMAGEQGYKDVRGMMKERATSQAREEAAQEMISGGNPRSAIAKLMSVGDIQGANTLANMGNNERDFTFRQQESQRAQGNADRSYGLQRDQMLPKPSIQRLKNPDGSEALVRVMPDGSAVPINVPSNGGAEAGNPFGGGKFNEVQGKAAGFTDRMLQSEAILSGSFPMDGGQGPATKGMDVAGLSKWEKAKANLPGAGKYYNPNDPEFQKYDQAKRDFINAQLRRESGAAIAPSEFENADKQYFPVPGDTPEVVAQKRANRRASIEAQGREGGPSYRPKATFMEDGSIGPYRPQARPGSQSGGPITKQQYDALPRGSQFVAPDGTTRIKP
jgi:hypothetical protein